MGTSARVTWRLSDIVRTDNHQVRPLGNPQIDPEPIDYGVTGDEVFAQVATGYTTITYTVRFKK